MPFISIQLENFIRAKYCHSLAKFKEDLLFNYKQEFLKRYYKKKESKDKIPLFSQFYKAYLQFFCSPILAELNLNELIEEMVERKAKVFYQNNYNEEEEKNKDSKKFINTIFFTNKVRKDISRKNTLTDLSKTTIEFMTTSNKNSANSYISLNNLVNEIGDGKNCYINSNFNIYNRNNINSNANNKINNNNNYLKINKIKKINKYKIKEINSYLNDKDKKRDIFKNSSKNTEVSSINERNITDIRVKSINNNDTNNKNMTSINVEMNSNKNEKSKENNISKPLYHKINIVNNKIIIINNSRSKGNILKSSKDKIKKRSSLSRNIKNNFLSTYSSNTTGIIESKDQTSINSNHNTKILKTFKKNIYSKGLSTKNCHSMKTKSDYKIKHIRIIKEKKLNTKIRPSIITTNSICTDNNTRKNNANPLVNYLYNYKNLNDKVCNTTEAKRKKLTNFQRFSNNIKNISCIQRLKNISKDKLSPFNKLASSNCSLGYSINSTNRTQNKNKTKNVLKISTYKTLEKLPKIIFNNKIMYKNKFSTQQQFKTNLKINNNNVNKNVLSLNLNKK